MSRPGRWPDRVRTVAAPGLSIAGIVLASSLAFWLAGRAWIAVAVCIGGMVLAAWRQVGMLAAARDTAERAERDRAAMEQALRRSQKMEAVGRLTVGVAHDFNNHLTVISSNVEMLARRLDATQEGLLRHTDAAMQGVQRAAVLTGRLLSFSRQSAPEPELVDVDRLLSGLAELLRRTVGDRNGLEVVPSHDRWFIRADVNQMEHALLSLAVNTRDNLRAGAPLTIEVSTINLGTVSKIEYPSVPPGDYLRIEIGERGVRRGWLAADDRSSADLAMARAFVAEAGGFLLRSDPAADGLSLRLLLPRYVPPALHAATHRPVTGGRPTILVVEDDDAVRAACVGVLRELEYEVLEAPDAMEAFRVIADHGGIDLLFTDLGLPGGVGGRALADAARNVDPSIRVLFTTGYGRVDCPGRGGVDHPDHGGTMLLRKPFNPAQLVSKVREVLASERTTARPETVQD